MAIILRDWRKNGFPPNGQARINADNILAKKLVFAFNGNGGLDVVRGIKPTNTNVIEASNYRGEAFSFAGGAEGNSDLNFSTDSATQDLHENPGTWAFIGTFTAIGSCAFACHTDANVDRGWQFGYIHTTSGDGLGWEGVRSSANVRKNVSDAPAANSIFTMVATYDGTNNFSGVNIYINGKLGTVLGSINGSGTTGAATAQNLYLGRRRFDISALSHSGLILNGVIANRVWTDAEVREFHNNPWQMYLPRRNVTHFTNGPAPTSLVLNGTAPITLGSNSTLLDSGVLVGTDGLVLGSASTLLDNPVLSGTPAITFNSNATLGGATSNLVSNEPITFGSNSTLLDNPVLSTTASAITFNSSSTLLDNAVLVGSPAITFGSVAAISTIDLAGTATITFGTNSLLTDNAAISTSAAHVTFGSTSTVAANAALVGTSTIIFNESATVLQGMSGSSAVIFGSVATLKASDILAGTSSIQFNSIPNLLDNPILHGSSAISFTAFSTPTLQIQASILINIGTTVVSTLMAPAKLVTSAGNIVFNESGILNVPGALKGTANILIGSNSTLQGTGTPVGIANILFGSNSTLDDFSRLNTTATAIQIASIASVFANGRYNGTSNIIFGTNSLLTATTPLFGSSSTLITSLSKLISNPALIGSSSITTNETGSVDVPGVYKGSSSATFNQSGLLLSNPVLAGHSAALIVSSPAYMSANGTYNAIANVLFNSNAIAAAKGRLIGPSTITINESGLVTGTSTLSGHSPIQILSSSFMSANGVVNGLSNILFGSTAVANALGHLLGSSALTFNESGLLVANPKLIGSSPILFSALVTVLDAAALSGSTQITFNTVAKLLANPKLIGTGPITFNEIANAFANAKLNGSAASVFNTNPVLNVPGTLTGISNIITFARLINAIKIFGTTGFVIQPGANTLQSYGVLHGTATETFSWDALLTVLGSLQGSIAIRVAGTGLIAGAANLNAISTMFFNGILFTNTFPDLPPDLVPILLGGLVPISRLTPVIDPTAGIMPTSLITQDVISQLIPIVKITES